MPQLLKQIQGNVDSGISSNTKFINEVTGIIQEEDYINVISFVAYLQNFTQCEVTSGLIKPQLFGLENKFYKKIENLNISY